MKKINENYYNEDEEDDVVSYAKVKNATEENGQVKKKEKDSTENSDSVLRNLVWIGKTNVNIQADLANQKEENVHYQGILSNTTKSKDILQEVEKDYEGCKKIPDVENVIYNMDNIYVLVAKN